MKTSKLILGLFVTSLVVGCSKDNNNDPVVINPPEVLTTMNVTLTPQSGDAITFKSYDSDGDGPIAPVITVSGPLKANTAYTGMTQLLNQSVTPAENTTDEIKKEANDHQFFYRTAGGTNAAFAYADTELTYKDVEPADHNGKDPFGNNPVGIAFTMTTGDAGTGTVNVTLIHLPQKNADGVSSGDITNAGGETDFTATFPITVE